MTLVEADVPQGLYDDWREVMVLPRGLTLAEQSALILELMRERR